MRPGTIEILGIRTMGCHGRQLVDQLRPQLFEVDLRLDADLAPSALARSPEDTVDYALIIEAVARTVELQTFPLLELLADRIAGVCLSLTAVTSVEVTVRKRRPEISVHVGSVGVTVRRESEPPVAGCEPTSCLVDSTSPSPFELLIEDEHQSASARKAPDGT